MTEFISFFVIIFAGLLFSEAFNRLHLPWVTALIISGVVLGPEGLGWLQPNAVIDFFSSIGLVFLMFMAGLEINFASFKSVKRNVFVLTILGALLPFTTALYVGNIFGLSGTATFLLAATFISSSIAVIVPSLESSHLFKKQLGKTIVASAILLDIISVSLFSLLIQHNTDNSLPLAAVYMFLILALVVLRLAVPKIENYFNKPEHGRFEQELRLIISVLLGTVVLFGLLGLHPVEAGFFAGLILSDSVKNSLTKAKLHAISYGLFIPVFFVVVGTHVDFGALLAGGYVFWLTLAIVLGSISAKFSSGWLASRLLGFSSKESLLAGVSLLPQLSVTLAVAFTGVAFGLVDQAVLTALIMLSIVTTLIGPPLITRLSKGLEN